MKAFCQLENCEKDPLSFPYSYFVLEFFWSSFNIVILFQYRVKISKQFLQQLFLLLAIQIFIEVMKEALAIGKKFCELFYQDLQSEPLSYAFLPSICWELYYLLRNECVAWRRISLAWQEIPFSLLIFHESIFERFRGHYFVFLEVVLEWIFISLLFLLHFYHWFCCF